MSLPTMKAIRWTAATEKLELVTVPQPREPEGEDIVVKVAYSGVCGTDLHIVKKEMDAKDVVILGHEFGGTVVSVGPAVTSRKPGDRVAVNPNVECGSCRFCARGQINYCTTPGKRRATGVLQDGGWAEYCTVPVRSTSLLQPDLPLSAAVMIEPYSCVLNGYKQFGQIPVDAQILVTGAGIIGLLWCSLLHYHGYRDVTLSELSDERRKVAASSDLGLKTCGPADLVDRFNRESAEEEGFDIIVDCTGSPRAVQQEFDFLRRGGKLNVFGCCPKVSQMTINPAEIMLKELTIFGTLINPFTFPAATTLVHNMADKYLSYEKLGVQVFPLEKYQEALDMLRSGVISKAVFAVDASQ